MLSLPVKRLTRTSHPISSTAVSKTAKRFKAEIAVKEEGKKPNERTEAFQDSLLQPTRGGWRLMDAMAHLEENGGLKEIVERYGFPDFFHDPEKLSTTPFEALCKMIVFQQLAGAAANTIWKRVRLMNHPVLSLT